MKYTLILLTTIYFITFTGCSTRTKGFIEDLYSNTVTRSANDIDYKNTMIINKQKNSNIKKIAVTNNPTPEIYKATGKIIDASYDKDIKLYMYVFIKDDNSDPITFYYNKDLKPIGNLVTITVKENFLTSITNEQKTTRSLKKRIKSNIKTPIIEKINTL